jgi:hypothetical protein
LGLGFKAFGKEKGMLGNFYHKDGWSFSKSDFTKAMNSESFKAHVEFMEKSGTNFVDVVICSCDPVCGPALLKPNGESMGAICSRYEPEYLSAKHFAGGVWTDDL